MLEQQDNQLLIFLKARFRAVGDAFRTNPRHESSARARLAWSAEGRMFNVRARLADISRAGAALFTKEPPPAGSIVRLCLTGEETTPWIEANVLGTDPDGRGKHRVRLQFRDPCPTFFLKVAVLGPVPSID